MKPEPIVKIVVYESLDGFEAIVTKKHKMHKLTSESKTDLLDLIIDVLKVNLKIQ